MKRVKITVCDLKVYASVYRLKKSIAVILHFCAEYSIPEEHFYDKGNDNNFDMDVDEDRALTDDSDYFSDEDDDHKEVIDKIVPRSEIVALNLRTKQCVIYFYYSMGGALALCASCMVALSDLDIRYMYAVRKHFVELRNTMHFRACSKCGDKLCMIFPCNMADLHTIRKTLSQVGGS